MAAAGKKIPYKECQRIERFLKKNKGNRRAAAEEMQVPITTLKGWIEKGRQQGFVFSPPQDLKTLERVTNVTEAECMDAWGVYERYGYNAAAAAEAMNVHIGTIETRVKKAEHKYGMRRRNLGVQDARDAVPLKRPKKGEVKRYLLTAAQNNTKIHEPTWFSLLQLAEYYGAEVKVATFTYAPQDSAGSEKRNKERAWKDRGHKVVDRWYDHHIEDHISDAFEQLAPGLVWCGHTNTLPTAVDPLRGTENLNGRHSGVFPHTRMEMRSIATSPGEATKFNWTTGAVTLRNYKQMRAGIVAEFYHCFGALLVEVDDAGNWWCRQLNATSEGVICDIDLYSTPEGVFEGEPVEAIKYGDIHKANIDPVIQAATWGEGGMVDVLRPKRQFLDDLLDFESGSHHNRRDPHKMYELQHFGRNSVWNEVLDAGAFVDSIHRVYPDGTESEEIVNDSNHDRHLDRWLKEVHWHEDLSNARTLLQCNDAWLSAIENGDADEFVPLEWLWRKMGVAKSAFVMNIRSEHKRKLSYVICADKSGGIEMALHGDLGPNGSRGGPRNLSKLGQKNVIGHSHSPGIFGGTYVAGVTGKMRLGYNVGPGSWGHAHVVVYANGKRQVILFWNGKPWADR